MKKRIKGLAIATRVFDNREGSSPQKFIDLAKRSSKMAELVIMAVNTAEDKSGALEALKGLGLNNLMVIAVTPWVKFVQAMNVIVDTAAHAGMKYLLSSSAEIAIDMNGIHLLMNYMVDDTLCVGARMKEHEFQANTTVEGTGTTIPWNTCCLWKLENFALEGFPLAGDAPFDPTRKLAGVEELTAIARMQANPTFGKVSKAKLVEVPGIVWHTDFSDDPARKVQHLQKLASKRERPAEQLRRLGYKPPIIEHISEMI